MKFDPLEAKPTRLNCWFDVDSEPPTIELPEKSVENLVKEFGLGYSNVVALPTAGFQGSICSSAEQDVAE